MSPPINIDGSSVADITIDGTSVSEVTVGGDVVFGSIPPDSENLQARYDARELALNDGDSVSTWPDETGNGNDLSINGSATFVDPGPVGVPAVRLGDGDYFDVSFGSAATLPYSLFFMGRYRTLSDFAKIWADNPEPSSGLRGLSTDSGNYIWDVNSGSVTTIGGSPDTNTHIHSSVIESNNGTLRIDGSSVGSADPSATDLDGLFIGTNTNIGPTTDTEFTEILVYDADESGNETDIESYLDRDTSLI